MKKQFFCAAAAALAMISAAPAQAQPQTQDDPYQWLENIEGEKALDWVRAQNARSQEALEADPRFAPMYEEALSVLTSKARLALGSIHNGYVYNFWQDDEHVRGVWRRASVESYRAGAPEWETLVDVDALAEEEDRNWVWGGVDCLSPDYTHCMVELSDGGSDAAFWREFDSSDKAFVEGGFYIPEGKSSVAWLGPDTLLVGADTGEGSLTTSGYPRTVRRLARDAALDEAPVLYEGEETDVAVAAAVEQDNGGAHVFVVRSPSFFESEYYYARSEDDALGDLEKLPLPMNADFEGVLGGRAIFLLREEWTYDGETYESGAVIAYGLAGAEAQTVMTPAANQSVEDVEIGKSGLVISYLEDVSGKAARFTPRKKGGWKRKEIGLPDNGVIEIISAGGGTDDAMLSFESLTRPEALYYAPARGKLKKIAETPAFYDATGVVVEQRFATSADGTKVPYFIMGLDSVLKQGNAPTVQYGYGGFLIPILPVYYEDPARPQHGALAGLMWVKRGGVLVLSNIRGGGEYGPKWHQAALKENRQRAFDDFIAISEDLIETGVTSPEKLGAIGRSNGGLLMGAMLTQRPDLYAAIDCGVPLFDMKRYNKLLAGASWMGEYGDPDIPEEWAYISKYSPYQNLKAGEPYPKVLFYTSTKDDRVHPGHARKAAAKMDGLGYDFFYYENIEGGHGGTANQDQLAYRTALEYAYFARMLMPRSE
ncbi:prolyl oligopeptidase family serine peptidase [Hyphococcus luteus]|uniref:S9 family peptidase n=1 Tax=Hyphococcus luteus TaxID=2058213 RepID=A0A2S7K6A2_9PROT|nr:prolyl oligopeptidase family serine peptidase [Marinicaulis flavus]PQA88033.1 S9 family peptidase [Marinicaulis flavus]